MDYSVYSVVYSIWSKSSTCEFGVLIAITQSYEISNKSYAENNIHA